MLIAAMVLGLIGGVTYFVGGLSAVTTVSWEDIFETHTGPPWWVIALIPIGFVGAVGGLLVCTKTSLGIASLALASVAALATGIASFEQSFELDNTLFAPPILPAHPFAGLAIYLPVPLLALIIATALAYTAKKAGEDKYAVTGSPPLN
jgi:hypothetical protein